MQEALAGALDSRGVLKHRSGKWTQGDYAVIRQLDLSGCNLNNFPADHLAFVQCNFDNASFSGTLFQFGTTFINCSMKNTDLTNTLAAATLFVNCDLTGMVLSPQKPYSQWTSEDLDGKTIPSIFSGCRMDESTKEYLMKNHCIFDEAKLTKAQQLDIAGAINEKLTRIITAPILDV